MDYSNFLSHTTLYTYVRTASVQKYISTSINCGLKSKFQYILGDCDLGVFIAKRSLLDLLGVGFPVRYSEVIMACVPRFLLLLWISRGMLVGRDYGEKFDNEDGEFSARVLEDLKKEKHSKCIFRCRLVQLFKNTLQNSK